jgi:recombination associated protein RdgC
MQMKRKINKMFYKNVKFFKLTNDFELNLDQLESQLSNFVIRPIGSQEMKVMGWSPVVNDMIVHISQGFATIKLATESRILPKEVIEKEVSKKVLIIEQETGQAVGKRQRQDIKSEIIFRLMPTSFTKFEYVWGTITPSGLVMINSGSDAKVEMFLAMLRKSIGSLPVVPIVNSSISNQLTNMVREELYPFVVLDKGQINSPEDEEIKLRNVNIVRDEGVREYIDEKFYVFTKLGVEWDESIQGLLENDCSFKALKFSDFIREQNDDIPKDQLLARFDADICINNLELNRLGLNLISEFGEQS